MRTLIIKLVNTFSPGDQSYLSISFLEEIRTPSFMDDTSSPTPLLSKSDSDDQQYSSSLDETIERWIGEFGWSQLLQVLLVSLAWLFDSQQAFISIFADAQPPWHCNDPPSNSTCNRNLCLLPKNSWSWDFSTHASIVSEWSLECAGSFITGLPASCFYVGCLAGGFILVALADSSFGRKNTLLLSTLLMSVVGLLTAFSPNIWVYSTLRFVSGFGRATIGTCSLVLSSELVGKRWRAQISTIGFLAFTAGFLSLPAIAYFYRGSSWRILYLWTCVPAVLYCLLVYIFVHESPRWLFLQGRKEDFIKTLKSMAPRSKERKLTLISLSNISIEQKSQALNVYSAIKIFFERKWALRRLMSAMVTGFGIGLTYYGMPLGVGNLNFDIYLSTTLNALSELPAAMVTFLLIGKFNRKSGLLGLTSLSGVCSVMCVIFRSSKWRGVQVGMELVSFFSACTAFDMLLIYVLELFPTCIRNSAVAVVRQVTISGGVFSPLLVAIGRRNGLFSYGVFGLTIGICGLFVGCLPETRGGTLCDTMDEVEQKETEATEAAPSITRNNRGVVV